jgi:hypothetical protein
MRAHSIVLLLFLLLTSMTAVEAQTTPLCPPKALLSIARAGAACANLEAGSACYGSGSVTSTVQTGSVSPGLVQLGDRVPLRDLEVIHAIPTGTDEISMAALAIRTSPRATDLVSAILVENAEMVSEVYPLQEVIMQAIGTAHVRAAPDENGAVIAELSVNQRITANGTIQGWVRVIVPATGQSGWIADTLLRGDGDVSRLSHVTTPLELVQQPFASARFNIGSSTACAGKLPAGLLLQTPSTDMRDAVTLKLNDVVLHLAGTMFIAADSDLLRFIMLDGIGALEVYDASQYIPAGAESAIAFDLDGYFLIDAEGYVTSAPSSPIPYDPALTAALPVNNLPRRFQVVPPQTRDLIDAQIAALSAPPPTPVPTVEPTPTNVCRRTVGRNADLMSGPGVDYEALGEIEAGTPIRPQLAFTDPRGGVWWQLPDSGWVARVDVVERGDCSAQVVPITERVAAPPNNTYSMERCQSSNGPVRAGQYVTFEFVPPAWNSLNEAYAAIRTDPGHFEINAERYNARASEPIRVQENVERTEARYLRRFTLNWRAEPGTFRITGDWLHYEPSCNLTVTVE